MTAKELIKIAELYSENPGHFSTESLLASLLHAISKLDIQEKESNEKMVETAFNLGREARIVEENAGKNLSLNRPEEKYTSKSESRGDLFDTQITYVGDLVNRIYIDGDTTQDGLAFHIAISNDFEENLDKLINRLIEIKNNITE